MVYCLAVDLSLVHVPSKHLEKAEKRGVSLFIYLFLMNLHDRLVVEGNPQDPEYRAETCMLTA